MGIGNINYGLTMRYLGMSMGIGIAIGITLIVGTLMTPIINGNFDVLINTEGGRMTLLGVLVALIGVGIVTRAGQLKERKMGIKAEEFNLKKGLVLAVMCGIFSAGMSFAMNAAKPMHEAAAALGVIHCMSLCQAMSSSWAAARSSTSVSVLFVWQK